MTTATGGTRSLWRRFRAWLGRLVALVAEVLRRDPTAVPPDPAMSYGPPPNEVEWPEAVDAHYATSQLNAVQVSIFWGADGSIYMARGPNTIGFDAAGAMTISNGNSSVSIAVGGTIALVTNGGSGFHVDPDGTIRLDNQVTVTPDTSVLIAGTLFDGSGNIVFAASGSQVPTSDPGSGGVWSNPANGGALTIGDGS